MSRLFVLALLVSTLLPPAALAQAMPPPLAVREIPPPPRVQEQPDPAKAQPAPGVRTMTVISDQDEAALYKLKQKRDAQNTPASAQSSSAGNPETAVHTLTVTPDAPPQTEAAAKPATTAKMGDPQAAAPKTDDKDTPLTPPDKLKPWGHMTDLFLGAQDPARATSVIAAFEQEAGRVSPLGLLQVARIYMNQNNMPRAARYFYAAQLRARFDFARWPGVDKKIAQEPVLAMIGELSPRISGWAASESARLSDVINDVRVWDHDTPYAYHPGYPLPDARDDKVPKTEAWPQILDDTRAAFFRDMGAIAGALKTMKR